MLRVVYALCKYNLLYGLLEVCLALVTFAFDMNMQERYIRRCLELAEKGKGNVAPNPMVGAVLVYNDRIIGEGWHEQYGQSHAEVNCLQNVREEDKVLIPESTMYVSLEPCAHHGKTPPCANRLVAESVKEVVVCNIDPNPKVNGGGMKILEQGGVNVTSRVLEEEGLWLNRRFFTAINKKTPYVILKWAQTPKGFIAPLDYTRTQISGVESMELVHKWRTEEQAILVGYNTALHDNPSLTARLWKGKNPLRIVIDKDLSLPQSLNLFDGKAKTWVINYEQEKEQSNVQYKKIEDTIGLPTAICELLAKEGIQSLIVEGGAKLLNQFIEADLWHEARVFVGGDNILDGINAPRLRNEKEQYTTSVGADSLTVSLNNNNPFVYKEGWSL